MRLKMKRIIPVWSKSPTRGFSFERAINKTMKIQLNKDCLVGTVVYEKDRVLDLECDAETKARLVKEGGASYYDERTGTAPADAPDAEYQAIKEATIVHGEVRTATNKIPKKQSKPPKDVSPDKVVEMTPVPEREADKPENQPVVAIDPEGKEVH